MVSRAGIAFSNQTTTCVTGDSENGELYTESLLDILPALKCSLYYGLRCFTSSRRDVKDSQDADLTCSKEMRDIFEEEFDKYREMVN